MPKPIKKWIGEVSIQGKLTLKLQKEFLLHVNSLQGQHVELTLTKFKRIRSLKQKKGIRTSHRGRFI
jgi:hypothetical protein